MRLHHLFVLILLFNFGSLYATTQNDYTEDSNSNRAIKILAIGNSFSQDAIETYLFELAQAANIQVIIGNLYIGGASLDLHWNNAKDDKPAYQYRKIDVSGVKTNTPNKSIADALADEEWDFISFQQVSSNSGQFHTYINPLPLLFNYVHSRATNPDVKYILHQTWAYSEDSTHKSFINYSNNQMTMYKSIVDAVGRAKYLAPIDMIVPAGTAIQNGRTSSIGDRFCRDGYHLEETFGRYTAACTWFEALFDRCVIGNAFKPETVTDYEADIAQHAAYYAVQHPKKITDMKDFHKAVATLLNNSCDLCYDYHSQF